MSYPSVAISEVANFINGFAFKPEDWGVSGLPIIRIQNLTDTDKPYNFTARKVPHRYLVKNGDILVSWSATIDVFEWNQGNALLNQHIFKVDFDHKRIDKQYFKEALRKTITDLSKFAHGSTMKHVVKKDFESHQIPLPPLDDQKRIAHLLGKVEGLIARRKQHLQQLDNLLKSVFLEMFGDPVRNEKGWKTDSLSSYGKFKNGLNFRKGESGIAVRYLGVGDFKSKAILRDIDDLASIQLNELPSTKYFLRDEDLLFVRSNGNRDLVGRCIAVYPGVEKVTYSGFCIRYRINDPALQSTYIAHLFRSLAFRRILFQGGQGANIQNISQKTLSALPIPIPSKDLQNRFTTIVKKIEKLKSRYQQSLTDLENLYGALSQKAFKGELDLLRVVLSAEEPESVEEGTTDIQEKQPMEPLFELPAPEEVSVLQTAGGRKSLLGEWLNAWLAHLGDAPLSAQTFMDVARQRLWELTEDDTPDWGLAEYDELKNWVFKALEQGRLTQGYDDANNRVQITATKG